MQPIWQTVNNRAKCSTKMLFLSLLQILHTKNFTRAFSHLIILTGGSKSGLRYGSVETIIVSLLMERLSSPVGRDFVKKFFSSFSLNFQLSCSTNKKTRFLFLYSKSGHIVFENFTIRTFKLETAKNTIINNCLKVGTN